MWWHIVIFILSCALLIKSGSWVVRSLTRITKYLGMTEFMVAFVLMAGATTMPELFVGIVSGLNGTPELSFGNIIGSNIINLTLAVGIGVLVAKGLKCDGAVLQRSSIYTIIIASLPLVLMLDGSISRVDGIILLLGLAAYIQRLFYYKERFTKIFSNSFGREWSKFKLFLKDLSVFLGSLIFLLVSAQGIVWSATGLAEQLGLPLMIIGAVVVALGTNLPELTFGIKSITMGHKDMVLGNLLGAVVFNSTLVLGVTVLLSPLEVSDISPYLIGIIFAVAALLFFTVFSRTGREITRKEAIFLLLLYIGFVLAEMLGRH
ncbi:MAG: sodium:calcium antiporter [Candidatus Paceibacterota bacterium]|jgi:cation:H+ antiporter|nr:sodium:calcium antiporter [Candidatus Paceibacterota bacterium]